MDKKFLFAGIGFIFTAFLISLIWPFQSGSLFVSSNKDVYSSGEIITVNLLYNSLKEIDEVRLTISGIKNKYDSYTLNVIDRLNFTLGENNLKYTMKIPSCSSCTGISSGEHEAIVTLEKEGVTFASKTISFSIQ